MKPLGKLKAIPAVLALSLVMAAGCSTKEQGGAVPSQDGTKEGAAAAKPVTINMWVGTGFKNIEGYDSPNYGDWEKAKALEFKKLYPHVDIKVEVIPFKDIEQKVNVAVAGGEPPDILFDSVPYRIMKQAYNNQLEPLDEVVKEDINDWKKSYLATGSYKNSVYGLVLYSQPDIPFINKAIFDKKGLADLIPKDRKWTWSQMEAALKKVVDKDTYGVAFYAKNEQHDQAMISHVMEAGSKFTNEAHTEYQLNSPEGVEGLSFMVKLAEAGLVAPGAANNDMNASRELFKQGKLALLTDTPDLYGTVESAHKSGEMSPSVVSLYGIIPIFKDGVAPKVVVTGENGYALFKQKDEQKKKMAVEFIKFLTKTDNIKAIAKATYGIGGRNSAQYTINNQDFNEVMKQVSQMEVIDLGNNVPYYAQVRQKFYPEIQAAFLKAKTPKQALDDFVKAANTIANSSKK